MRIPEVFTEERVIPVARNLTVDHALRLVKALRAGGISSLEVTMESGAGPAVIASLAGEGSTVGAGTIVTIDDARAAVDAGAAFLVSPHFDPYLVEWAQDEGVFHLPGVFTATEAAAAMSLGVDTVKLFPASTGGPGLIRALHGPFPTLGIVPTGGIDAGNAAEFLAAGAIAVGVGGWLTDHEDLGLVSRRADQLRRVV